MDMRIKIHIAVVVLSEQARRISLTVSGRGGIKLSFAAHSW